MATLFKPTIISYRDADGLKCSLKDAAVLDEHSEPVTQEVQVKGKQRKRNVLKPGCRRIVEKTSKWYGRIKGSDGKLKSIPLDEDKDLSKEILAKKQLEASRERQGLSDPYEKHRRRPLIEHLDEYRESLKAGNSEQYAMTTYSRVLTVVKGCKFAKTADISLSRVETFLKDLRTKAGVAPSCSVSV